MRRRLLCGLACVLLLAACVQQPQGLPAEEVLQHASVASQNLLSAQYTVKGTYVVNMQGIGTLNGMADISGVLQDGGRQVSMLIDAQGTLVDTSVRRSYTANLEMIVAPPDETYVRIHRIITEPAHPLLDVQVMEQLAGRWWLVSAGSKVGTSVEAVTPDPQLIRAQSQVVRIEKNHGIVTIDDRAVYHFETALDPEKLIAFLTQSAQEGGETVDMEGLRSQLADVDAKGELWIDAQTFLIHRIRWEIAHIPVGKDGTASLSFTMDLSKHNEAQPIAIPSDALPYSPSWPMMPLSSASDAAVVTSSSEETIIEDILHEEVPSLP
ncbi:MAG: hypothetical protein PHH13_04485 [Candidatus Peribacteraceae bacterium]|nr:hypothetical protein [Candidatus Peribacteraceae bacterium]